MGLGLEKLINLTTLKVTERCRPMPSFCIYTVADIGARVEKWGAISAFLRRFKGRERDGGRRRSLKRWSESN